MILPNRLAEIATKLDTLGLNYVFVGGSIVEFLLDYPGLSPMRPTDDLDLIVEVVAGRNYSEVEQKLRDTGFAHDMSPGAPMCRWLHDGIIIDIMPTDGALLGLNTAWFVEALATARTHVIGGVSVPMISPVAFIATKLAAFADRGAGDYHGSHDLEDIITVIDGRSGIVDEVDQAEPRLRAFVTTSIGSLVMNEDFQDSLSGQLPFDAASQRRLPALRQKLRLIAGL
ncbi:MAG: hypothetical protein JF599_05355 [Verrucomicrobia bacterium]|nr:hypothetical protein [Verrucomicrobiota bacterium]